MANIFLYGQIGQDHVQHVANVTKGDPNAARLDVFVSSMGGGVMSGLQIKGMIEQHSASVKHFHIEGFAASIATVIPMIEGATVSATMDSVFMIHNVRGGVQGSPEEVSKAAEGMAAQQEILINAYDRRSNLSRDEITNLMENETFLSAQEALDAGFIDSITNEQQLVACYNEGALQFKLNKEANSMPEENEKVEDLIAADTKAEELATEENEEVEEELEEVEELETEEETEEEEELTLMDTLKNWFDNNAKLKDAKDDLEEAEEELGDAEEEVTTLTNQLEETSNELNEKTEALAVMEADFIDHLEGFKADKETFNKVLENIIAGNLTASDLQDIVDGKKDSKIASETEADNGLIKTVSAKDIEEPVNHIEVMAAIEDPAEKRKYYLENIKK